LPRHNALRYVNLTLFEPPVYKKGISNSYCIEKVEGFYLSDELRVLRSAAH